MRYNHNLTEETEAQLKMKSIIVILMFFAITSARFFSIKTAEECTSDKCQIENNCRCSNTASPLSEGEAPLLIALTIDESVQNSSFNNYWQPLLSGRKNPDGNQIGATFFVPHDYTDYQRVHDLYVQGFEIADGTVTKNSQASYWIDASLDTLTQEFSDQRTIISYFANISIDDIQGARMPQLQLNGDLSIAAYSASNLTYDSSWTARSNEDIFPYTLDYLSTQRCRSGTTCPTESHPGFWISPIIDLHRNDTDHSECNTLSNCNLNGTADQITDWLLAEVESVRTKNKAPMTIMLSSLFFASVDNSLEGFKNFLDKLPQDVFLVSLKQVIDWVKNPVPVDQFQTEVPVRDAGCTRYHCISLEKQDDNTFRNLATCVQCPDVYPWLGNPYGTRL